MRDAFERVASAYESVKKTVAEKWEGFKKKFEGTKSEISQEVMSAKSPEELIALGKKLQAQGEALKVEEDGVKQEESKGGELEAKKKEMIGNDETEAIKMNKDFDEAKTAEEAKAEEERLKLQIEEDEKRMIAEKAREVELLAQIQSGNFGGEKPEEAVGENVDQSKELGQEDIEKIYGLNEKDMKDLMDSRGYLEGGVQANDSNRKERMEEFHNKQRSYDQVRVKLFDRVLSGTASENEIKMAEDHAVSLAKAFGIDAFKGVPKSWYSNERLAGALANSSKDNKKWVEYVKKNYTSEQLKNGGFEEIGDDGFAHTYAIKGF